MKRYLVMGCLLVSAWTGGCRTAPIEPVGSPQLYTVAAGDRLHIDVFREAEISRDYEVSAAGTINHPLLGPVEVSGLTLQEVQTHLTTLLAHDYFVDPRVTVSITRSTYRPVMIFGQVRNPGAYEVPVGQPLTLLQVIARAGGFTDIAAQDRVRIVRQHNGAEQSLKVSVTDLLRGRNGVTDIDLRAGDVITVPETLF